MLDDRMLSVSITKIIALSVGVVETNLNRMTELTLSV